MLSLDPGTSIRRFALTACVIAVAATLMLLPKSQDELMRWFSIAALALLAICYLGILLAPNLSIHLATDAQEPQLAGNWRGSFGHKNVAAAMMAMLLFIGIYIMRSGAWLSGVAIVGLSSLFLLYSAGKSSLTLFFAVLAADLADRGRSLVLASRGDVVDAAGAAQPAQRRHRDERQASPRSRKCCRWMRASPAAPTSGPSRCSRCSGGCRPATASPRSGAAVRSGICREGKEWAAYASHSHNGYLDTALAMGLPGLALLIVVLVIAPLRNFHAADRGGNNGPLAMVLLRIWLFGLYLSSMESFFLDRADPLWFTFLMAVFGLHYLARFRAQGVMSVCRSCIRFRMTANCARIACATSCHQPSKSNGTCTDGHFSAETIRSA